MPLLAMNSDPWPTAMHLDHAAYGRPPPQQPPPPQQHAWSVDGGPKHAADLSTFRAHLRHSPMGGHDASASPRPMPSGAWRLHHGDHAHAPPALQVHIPRTSSHEHLSRPHSTTAAPHFPDGHHQQHDPQYHTSSTLLPSFASFQERTARNEDGDLIIAPMSQRLDCNMCTKLKPLVREIAQAVGDVDENVQSLCTKAVSRPLEFPDDSAVRTAHWILDRLRDAKVNLQDVGRRPPASSYFPANHLKRNADQWERDELPPKRPRSGASDQPYHSHSAFTPRDESRPPLEDGVREPFQPLAYSPAPESISGSAHPRQASPSMSVHGGRALPSPTSLHHMQTSLATSTHMAALQHQVSVTTLALQTLEGEYAALLQKLQREKVKTQTIEKKTTVADQEVNELTSKNEELTEQIHALELQLEDSDKKREAERAEAAKEKEQWSRMLDMGSRLHSQVSKELQGIKDEKTSLLERIQSLEQQRPNHAALTPRASSEDVDGQSDHTSLKGDVALLTVRVDSLRSALEDAQRQNRDLEDKLGAFAQHSGQVRSAITRVLRDDDARLKTRESEHDAGAPRSSHPTSADSRQPWSPKPTSMQPPRSSRGSTTSLSNTATSLERGSLSTVTSGTACSPGSADLGFDTATSSEDVIRSLGPLPAPPSKSTYDTARYRDGDVTSQDPRYRSDPAYGHGEPGAWTPTDSGHFWNSNDRLIQLRHHPAPTFRASQPFDSPYRAASSPYSSSSPRSDVADENSSNNLAPLDRYAPDADLGHHVDVKPLLVNGSLPHLRHDNYSSHPMAYTREASYMLPPPRPI